jgi:hypothetical protein
VRIFSHPLQTTPRLSTGLAKRHVIAITKDTKSDAAMFLLLRGYSVDEMLLAKCDHAELDCGALTRIASGKGRQKHSRLQ